MPLIESTSNLVAGMVSFNGLIPIFGTTGIYGVSETELGLMVIPSYNDWMGRIKNSSYDSSGPTGAWAQEWWTVNNYLQYGGTCVIGATGSTGDYYSSTGVLSPTYTPLHSKDIVLDVVFEGGSTASAQAAAHIAKSRQDCIAFVGNNVDISRPINSLGYTFHFRDFGVTADSEFVSFFASRKKSIHDVTRWTNTSIIKTTASADAAGCLARTIRTNNIWVSPAGISRGRILSVVGLSQSFTEAEAQLLYAGRVNPLQIIPGIGTYLMGNKTSYNGADPELAEISTSNLIIYLKSKINAILSSMLFESNNASSRSSIVSQISSLLSGVVSTNGITTYKIECDEYNNTTATILAKKLIVDIEVTKDTLVETIVLNFTVNTA